MSTVRCILVVALRCEARPLIEQLGLGPAHDLELGQHWRAGGFALACSGVGKRAAAAAVERVARLASPGRTAWLDVGVAGGARLTQAENLVVGNVVLGTRVVDERAGRSTYPAITFPWRGRCGTVRTVEEPVSEYREDGVYEMEASAFVDAARRHSSAELVHVLKVVSDTPDEPVATLNAARIEELMAAAADETAELGRLLSALAGEEGAAGRYGSEPYLARHHYSVTRRRQLELALRRCRALGVSPEPALECGSAGAAVLRLEQLLGTARLELATENEADDEERGR